MKTRKLMPAFALLAAGVLAVGSGAQAAGKVHWGYFGDEGPEKWASLSHDFETCGMGKEQSPIDVTGAMPASGGMVETSYADTPLELVNNGHTIQVNYAPGNFATLGGKRYELLQFHFHGPSEHTVDGKPFAMEAHLVHSNEAGDLAVLGILMKEGAANDALKPIWQHLPAEEGTHLIAAVRVNVTALLPDSLAVNRYDGSLTTPPCSEGVAWNLLRKPVEVSAEQIAAFRAIISPNARPTQPLNGRRILATGDN